MPQPKIDLSKLSDTELQSLRSELVTKIAERLKVDPGANLTYDRHGSGHSRSSSVNLEDSKIKNPGNVLKNKVIRKPK